MKGLEIEFKNRIMITTQQAIKKYGFPNKSPNYLTIDLPYLCVYLGIKGKVNRLLVIIL
jgi:hypothetical protein